MGARTRVSLTGFAAAYRAFTAKTPEATALLVVARGLTLRGSEAAGVTLQGSAVSDVTLYTGSAVTGVEFLEP